MEYTGQNQGRQEETHHPTHRFQSLFVDLLLMAVGYSYTCDHLNTPTTYFRWLPVVCFIILESLMHWRKL